MDFDKNFTLKKRFKILVFSVLFNLVFLGLFGIYSSYVSNKNMDESFNKFFPLLKNILLVDMLHDGLKGNVTRAVLSQYIVIDDEDKKEILTDSNEMSIKIIEYINNVKKINTDSLIHEEILKTEPILNKYVESGKKVIHSSLNKKNDYLAEFQNFLKIFKILEEEMEKLSTKIEKSSEVEILKIENVSNILKLFSVLIMIFSLILTLLISYYFFRKIASSIDNVVVKLVTQVDDVKNLSNEMNKTSQSLSSSATQQNDSLQKTAAAIQQISTMIKKTSEFALQSNQTSKQSEASVNEGKNTMADVILSIQKIKSSYAQVFDQVKISNKKITEITKVISEVAAKTQVINEIVFKTKLLSFNASVEAARAGDQGRGFSVVAEEVGNLAKMSGDAAKEINELLKQSIETVNDIIISSTTEVEKFFKIGNDSIQETTNITKSFDIAMQNVVENVTLVNKSVNDITLAAKEEELGILEIVEAVNQLENVAQLNSNVASQSYQSASNLTEKAKEISNITEELKYIVSS
ncbi:HAMP domain-containing methyl-accepting chemotaxis protein [Spirobacillus cienkowskii]|uniref:HAMP domain-containing methyl-accepting chemotaxis protein n=1 Tax=Spirobacillus cienkowskii TaxID=495820 RepID=UPI0030D38FEE